MTEKENDKSEDLREQSKKLKLKLLHLMNEIDSLQNELSNPDYADDHVKLMEIQNDIDNLQTEHDEKAENWLYITGTT